MLATHQAFAKLYADHYAFVWHALRRLGVPTLAIDDAVQDTFVTAFRRQDSFDGRSPRAWLYCIGRRVANNANRARTRRERRHAEAPAPATVQRPSEGQVGAQRALAAFLNTLNDADRELFVLSEIDGLTGPELVAALGRKLPTLYGRIRVLRARLRTQVGADFDPAGPRGAPPARSRTASWIAMQPWLQAATSPAPAGILAGLWGAASSPWVTGTLAATLVSATAVWSSRDPAPAPSQATPTVSTSTPDSAPATTALAQVPAPAPAPAEASAPPRPPLVPQAAAPPRRAKPVRQRASAPPPRASELAEETKQLREVQNLLRAGEAGAALETLAVLERRFPRSVQSDLRAVLRVEALCASNRAAQAHRVADKLRTETPGSPMMRRLSGTCAGKIPSSQP